MKNFTHTRQFLSVKCLSQILLVVTSKAYNLKKKHAAIISTKVLLSALFSCRSSGPLPNNVSLVHKAQRSVRGPEDTLHAAAELPGMLQT